MEEENKVKATKKVQYAIRMLDWHTMLAKRYHSIVKAWLDKNDLDYNTDLLEYIEKRKKKINDDQLTIFDFIRGENNERKVSKNINSISGNS